jgi:hypothetical protein
MNQKTKEANFFVEICNDDKRLKAKLQQCQIDEELKQLRKKERQIKREIEDLERRFNRLGQDHHLAIYPFGPLD